MQRQRARLPLAHRTSTPVPTQEPKTIADVARQAYESSTKEDGGSQEVSKSDSDSDTNKEAEVPKEEETPAEETTEGAEEAEQPGDEVEKPKSDAATDPDAALPFHNHPRWKEVIEQKKTFEQEAVTLKTELAQVKPVKEWADHHFVSGWAWLPDHPNEPVVLEILDKQEVIAVTLADQHRSDLRRSGIGNGCHAFHVELPRALDPAQSYRLVVRRAADGRSLPGSPFPLRAHGPSETLIGLDLAAMVNGADLCETRRVIAWLEQQALKLHAVLTDSQPLASLMEDGDQTKPLLRRQTAETVKTSKLA